MFVTDIFSLVFVFAMSSIVICTDAATKYSNKYSKEANNNDNKSYKDTDNPFRMLKVNLLWKKASKRVTSDEELEDLYEDLKLHDRYEAELKKMLIENLDEYGTREEMVLENYKRIMGRYLPEHVPDENEVNNEIITDEEMEERNDQDYDFQDSRLQTMWTKAQQQGFSELDLQMLREEMEHQQMRIKEFELMDKELFFHADENSVELDEVKMKMSSSLLQEHSEKVKIEELQVEEGYQRLERLTSSLQSSESDFEDPRVQQLWSLAKRTNWTITELESFQTELHHFESRIVKHTHYKKELKYAKDAKDNDKKAKEKHDFFAEKTSILKKEMQKLQDDLHSRVKQALHHVEL